MSDLGFSAVPRTSGRKRSAGRGSDAETAAILLFPELVSGHRAANTNSVLQDRGDGFSSGFYAAHAKRWLDLALVLIGLPVALPVIFLCAAALWMEGGSPFYTQARLGRGGRTFRILKLRTMVRGADARLQELLDGDSALRKEWQADQKLKEDPRITPLGRILRAASLDELPQLWNVVIGEMSLVGPRPMMPSQLPLYADPGAYFRLRPGITGIWQVSDRNEAGFGQRARADAEYSTRLSLGLDLRLIWQTVGAVLGRTGY